MLPIGGLKEKVLAAHRGGIKTVLIPAENEKDILEIPANDPASRSSSSCVDHMDQVLRKALVLDNPDDPVPQAHRGAADPGGAAAAGAGIVRRRDRPPT